MLNENIRRLRKAKGLSQEELAVKLHVVRQTVSKWEKGLSVPDAETMIHIAEVLDTSVNVLLGASADESTQDTALTAIASKLELLNEQFARQSERRRKIWRIVFIAIAVVAAGMLVRCALGFFHHQAMMGALVGPNASESIIGGAD
ncbi:MAG: helix-turn-helix transcriptional regulator [Oscillospiraceae bacterium]|nr:helix-turn-helix transcriptional regulator [Oscillospiraceae bacterium]